MIESCNLEKIFERHATHTRPVTKAYIWYIDITFQFVSGSSDSSFKASCNVNRISWKQITDVEFYNFLMSCDIEDGIVRICQISINVGRCKVGKSNLANENLHHLFKVKCSCHDYIISACQLLKVLQLLKWSLLSIFSEASPCYGFLASFFFSSKSRDSKMIASWVTLKQLWRLTTSLELPVAWRLRVKPFLVLLCL